MSDDNIQGWLILCLYQGKYTEKTRLLYYPCYVWQDINQAHNRIKENIRNDRKLGRKNRKYVTIPLPSGANKRNHADTWMRCYNGDLTGAGFKSTVTTFSEVEHVEDAYKNPCRNIPELKNYCSMEQNLYNRNGLTGHGLAAASLDVSKQQETIMSIQVSNPTLINGRGEDSFSVEDLIGLIRKSEEQIKSLEGVNTESKTVKALIKREQDGIAAIVKILDSREI